MQTCSELALWLINEFLKEIFLFGIDVLTDSIGYPGL